jgi:hypothetical protein
MVRDYAKQQRYTFMGPIKVHLEKADDLDTGLYRVRSRTLASSTDQQAPERAPAGPPPGRPGGYGYPAAAPGASPAGAPPMPSAPPPGVRPGPSPMGSRPGAAPGPAAGGRMRHWIEINGARHQISRPTLVLGRSTEADVRIDDPGVSRRHCEIRTGTPSTIQDLGSTNGIVVDGQHTTRATLRDGSRIVVGSTTIIYRQAEG